MKNKLQSSQEYELGWAHDNLHEDLKKPCLRSSLSEIRFKNIYEVFLANRASVRSNNFGLQTKMESYDEAVAPVLKSFDTSKLETKHKLIFDALRESKDCKIVLT